MRLPSWIPRPRFPRERPPLLAVVVLVLVAAGVAFGVSQLRDGGSGETRTVGLQPPQASGGGGKPLSRHSFLERLIPPPGDKVVKGPGVPRSLADLVNRLPLNRKVAQLILAGFRGQDLTAPIYAELRRLDLGGVVIEGRNYQNAGQLAALAGETGVVAKEAGNVPPFVFAPQEGGEFSDFPDLPPARALSDLRTASEGGSDALASGQTLKSLGVHGVLGPVIDVGTETGQDAIGPRAFSDDPAAVARFARAALRGYARAGVLAAPKHFPGLGGASIPTDQGPASVGLSLEELEKRDLVPFAEAVRVGAPAMMLSHALYAPNYSAPGSLTPTIVTGLLRRQLHFNGIAITDDLASPAISADWTVPDAAIQAIRSGADMVWISGTRADQEAAHLALVNAVRRGEISLARLNEALLRVLSAKQRFGLIRARG